MRDWTETAAMIVGLLALIVGVAIWTQSGPDVVDPDRVRSACLQYRHLDLTGWEEICRDVGAWDLQPAQWPIVQRPVMPEDLDR